MYEARNFFFNKCKNINIKLYFYDGEEKRIIWRLYYLFPDFPQWIPKALKSNNSSSIVPVKRLLEKNKLESNYMLITIQRENSTYIPFWVYYVLF